MAWQNKIYIPRHFSLFFLLIDNLAALVDNAENNLHRKQQIVDALVDYLNRKENTIAWEAVGGIGIINSVTPSAGLKVKELSMAREHLKDLSRYFPDLRVRIGIANYADDLILFADRLHNAETSLAISQRIWPDQMICHYEDCGIYQVLAPFARTGGAADYVMKTLGPLIEHDQADNTNLTETLEKILAGLSFKEIGEQMYLHHKTIQLRKQKIEQILKVSLDAYETRMALSTALQLKKLAGLH